MAKLFTASLFLMILVVAASANLIADHRTLVPTVEEPICKEFVSGDVTEPIDEAGECKVFITCAGCTPDECRPQCIQRCNGRGSCAPVDGASTCGCLCTCPC